MIGERYKNEIIQLLRLKKVLDGETKLPLRFDLERLSVDSRKFKLTIRGITSLINIPRSGSTYTASTFILTVEIPSGYPQTAIPDIRFQQPIPFHPHIHSDGRICWGTGNEPQIDLNLLDWFRVVIEYLQYYQDQSSRFKMNSSSPANTTARDWWRNNSSTISRYVPPIDISRLCHWIDQSRG
jgi:ubiquitin-protein ligase